MLEHNRKISPTHLFHTAFQNYSVSCLKGPLEYWNSLYQSINRSLLLASDLPSAVFGHPRRTKGVFHGRAACPRPTAATSKGPALAAAHWPQSRREHLSYYVGVTCLRVWLPNKIGSSPRAEPALLKIPSVQLSLAQSRPSVYTQKIKEKSGKKLISLEVTGALSTRLLIEQEIVHNSSEGMGWKKNPPFRYVFSIFPGAFAMKDIEGRQGGHDFDFPVTVTVALVPEGNALECWPEEEEASSVPFSPIKRGLGQPSPRRRTDWH